MQTEFPERYITLGLKIAYYRKKAGLTQEVLAERIGKSVNFVGQVEGTGTIRGVSLETLFKIGGGALLLRKKRFKRFMKRKIASCCACLQPIGKKSWS